MADAPTHTEGQRPIEQTLVEIELLSVVLAALSELAQQRFTVDADAHRREFKRPSQHSVPNQQIAIKTRPRQ